MICVTESAVLSGIESVPIMTRKSALAAMILGGLSSICAGQTPQEYLADARQQADIFREASGPFQMDVNFVAQLNIPAPGHLSLKWNGKDEWRSSVSIAGYQEIVVRRGDTAYTARNTGFTPLPVQQLLDLLRFAARLDELTAKKLEVRGTGDAELACIKADAEKHKQAHYEMCFDPASHDLASLSWERLPDHRFQEFYSDYLDFQGRRYPRRLSLVVNGTRAVSATVVKLAADPFDQAWLTPPQGAFERRNCLGLKQPVALKIEQPQYPPSAKANGIMGDTTVSLTVEADGSIGDVELVGRAAHTMDNATLEAVKKWKFKPAMCGAEPVVADVQVTVSFRLH